LSDSPQSPDSRLLTIIATYNERENLPDLVEQLQHLIPAMQILVIDDNSPDGTGTWCRSREASDASFQCIHRSGKLGLGSATVAGFRFALQRRFDLIATMDADFSHAPQSLAEMVDTMRDEANHHAGVAIGSRYVAGGAIEGWPFFRHLSSRLVNGFARVFLRLPTRDNSGAFRVYRRSALEAIEIDRIQAQGYAYLEEILWRLHRQGVGMLEVPITFVDRAKGNSKTNLMMGVQVFWHLAKIAVGVVR
jgi:dolichol-phosphate mannosyltransferase